MAEFEDSQAAVETQQEVELETQNMQGEQDSSAADARALTVSMDDFAALEERVVRAVTLVKQERQARTDAEQRADRAEEEVHQQAERLERMDAELAVLRAERDHVRERVEKLLQQLDALEL